MAESKSKSEEYQRQLAGAQYIIERDFVGSIEKQIAVVDKLRDANKHAVDSFLDSHKEIHAALADKGLSWDNLSAEQRQAVAEQTNDKDFISAVKHIDSLRQRWQNLNSMLDEHKNKLVDIRANMAGLGRIPLITPEALEDFDLKDIELDFKADTTGAIFDNHQRSRQYKEQKIAVLEQRRERLKAKKLEEDARVETLRAELKQRLGAETKVRDDLQARQSGGEDVTTELQIQSALLERLNAEYDNLYLNGSQEQLNLRLQIKETDNAIKELEADLDPIENKLMSDLANGVINMFDAILLKGNTFKDAWNNLWQSIASFALQQLLLVQLQALSTKFGWGFFGKSEGGSVTEGISQNSQTAVGLSRARERALPTVFSLISNIAGNSFAPPMANLLSRKKPSIPSGFLSSIALTIIPNSLLLKKKFLRLTRAEARSATRWCPLCPIRPLKI